jgi:hypothetical protein
MVDFVCQRYGLLPSEFVAKGDTYDIHTATVAIGYENWIRKNPDKNNKHGFNQAELQEMLDNVKQSTKSKQTPGTDAGT